MIKSEVPDGVENSSSLETATIEGTREDSLAEAAIGRSELDEEKNESEIMNVNFGMICRPRISHNQKRNYSEKYIR